MIKFTRFYTRVKKHLTGQEAPNQTVLPFTNVIVPHSYLEGDMLFYVSSTEER